VSGRIRARPKVSDAQSEKEAWAMFDIVVAFLIDARWKQEAEGWVRMHCKEFRSSEQDPTTDYTTAQGELWLEWQEFVQDTLEEELCDQLAHHGTDVGVEELVAFLDDHRDELVDEVGPMFGKLQKMTSALATCEDFVAFAAMMREHADAKAKLLAARGSVGDGHSLKSFQSHAQSAMSTIQSDMTQVRADAAVQNVRVAKKLASLHLQADEMAAALARSLRGAGPVEIGSAEANAVAAELPWEMAVASRLHHMWRSARQKMPDGTYEPRIKIVDGKEYDIANLVHIQLPPKLQASNCAAADDACDQVRKGIERGMSLRGEAFLTMASSAQHECWMVMNADWADPGLMVPFSELSREEQDKDTVIIVAAVDEWFVRHPPGSPVPEGSLRGTTDFSRVAVQPTKSKFSLVVDVDEEDAPAESNLLKRRRESRRERRMSSRLMSLGESFLKGLKSPRSSTTTESESPRRRGSIFRFGSQSTPRQAVPRTPSARTSPNRRRRSTMAALADSLKGLFAKTPQNSGKRFFSEGSLVANDIVEEGDEEQ
jgi:hypothetical protein